MRYKRVLVLDHNCFFETAFNDVVMEQFFDIKEVAQSFNLCNRCSERFQERRKRIFYLVLFLEPVHLYFEGFRQTMPLWMVGVINSNCYE